MRIIIFFLGGGLLLRVESFIPAAFYMFYFLEDLVYSYLYVFFSHAVDGNTLFFFVLSPCIELRFPAFVLFCFIWE